MSQLNKWMLGGKISKLVIVITSKETGEHVERWQFDVRLFVFLLHRCFVYEDTNNLCRCKSSAVNQQ